MPIEFRCTSCGKLLRTPDDSAGKDAQCPSCGTVVPVPLTSQPDAGGAPFGEPFGQPAADSGNPYQAPAFTVQPAAYQSIPGIRSGPPWERDGASFKSFFETVKLGFSFNLFPDMRREGGLGAPIWFGIAGGMIGVLASMAYQMVLSGAQIAMLGGEAGGGEIAGALGGLGIGLICVIILAPLGLVLGMFLTAGIYHLMLMMLKGAHFPFETTFRVVAYSSGVCSLLLVIPFCGQYVQGILQIVMVILGLANAQEISGGKATAAVLIPVAVCCVVGVGIVVAVIAAVAASAGQAGAF
jgi:hypothetical protein